MRSGCNNGLVIVIDGGDCREIFESQNAVFCHVCDDRWAIALFEYTHFTVVTAQIILLNKLFVLFP